MHSLSRIPSILSSEYHSLAFTGIVGVDNSKVDMNSEIYIEETHMFANLFLL